jgi:uncharacterized membrane protein YeiB
MDDAMPSPNDSSRTGHSERIIGFDVARSLAILGMILVHFGLVTVDAAPRSTSGPRSIRWVTPKQKSAV